MSPVTDWDSLAKDAKEANPGYEAATEGNYNLTIVKVESQIAQSSGNQKFHAEMTIDSGPFKGKKVWHDFTVARDNKRALGIFFQNMAVFDMPFDFFNRDTQDEAIIQNLVGKRLSADLIVDNYNPEKPKNKISPGWSIKAPKGPSELDLPAQAGVPGGSANVAAGPPPANNYQAPPAHQAPPQYAQQPEPVYQQPQYAQQAPQVQQQAPQHEDPWQPPTSPPAPPANANWGAPPPAPPGLQP